ncbi:glycine betaine ABC transporter substrate-binding protein [Microbacterium sp. gxy059]|uniref:ABC transporter substrate-binding protein n=1 Tax=Microbacterium sp. gxy059 TaxID=2957199 RepID=UPI003D977BE9
MTLRRISGLAVAGVAVLALAGCGTSDTVDGDTEETTSSDAIVIGSQDYYSNEIVAELYAQALEAEGFDVDRQLRIGQRETYLPEIEAGEIDLFPEYTGPLLQYWNADATERGSDEVYSALEDAAPDGLRVLEQAAATDQDAYVVTREFADEWDLETVADLANVTEPLTMGANSEAETRPNGPNGLKEVYGVDAGFTPIEDGGGPLTVKALEDGDIQLAIIYTADPSLDSGDLVVLEDTEDLFTASHLVPIASERLGDDAAAVVDAVSAELAPEDLIALNARSVQDELPAATIAGDWLAEKGLAG